MTDEENVQIEDMGGDLDDTPINFEGAKGPCYGVRFSSGKVHITCDNKTIVKLDKAQFPKDLDLNSLDTIASIIKVIREDGLHAFLDKIGISN